jgi:predicted nucleic acid-binding protein
MSGDERTFVDTNVLLYAHDPSAARKHDQASHRLARLWHTGSGVLSTQVLQEFYVNATRKVAVPLSPVEARLVVSTYAAWPVHRPGPEHILSASELQERHQLSFGDALILVSAGSLGATRLLTEDLQHGQVIGGVRVDNPFVTA